MKSSTLAALSILLASSTAFAADLRPAPVPVKAAPVAVFDWSGFYLGFNAGGGWGTNETTANSITFKGQAVNLNELAAANNSLNGVIAGGQVGYQYQFAGIPIVVGLEGDFDWSGIEGKGPCAQSVLVNCSETDKLKWTADLTGRAGYAFGPFLPYFKGGIAWGDWSHDARVPVGNLNGGNDFIDGSLDKVRTGWLLGAGLEYGITDHISAKLEYNFLDFGSTSENVSFSGPSLGGQTGSINASFKDQVHVFKGGVNYRF